MGDGDRPSGSRRKFIWGGWDGGAGPPDTVTLTALGVPFWARLWAAAASSCAEAPSTTGCTADNEFLRAWGGSMGATAPHRMSFGRARPLADPRRPRWLPPASPW